MRAKSDAFFCDATFFSFVVALNVVLAPQEHKALIFYSRVRRRKYLPTKRASPRFLGETERCTFLGGQTTTKKKADERRIETTFATLNRMFFFQFCRLPCRPFLLALRKQHYRVCRECVYFKHITETIRLEKKKKKKKREKRRVVVVYV